MWIRNSPENAVKVYQALAEFGAPLKQDRLTPEDFTRDDITYQIGVAPLRIDVLTRISGLDFAQAWPNRMESTFFSVPVNFISRNDLIANKAAAGRSSDLEHLEQLRRESGKKNSKK